MTTTYPLTPKAPTTPAGSETYRVSRVLALDEEARQKHNSAEKNFRHESRVAFPIILDLFAITGVAAIAWVLGHLGFWFLDSALMLQLAFLGLSLHTTRRGFSLLHAHTSLSAAHYRLGKYQRYLTTTDAFALSGVALLGLMHLNLAPNAFALAAAGAVAAVLVFRQISHRSFALMSKRAEEEAAMEELTKGL